MKLTRSFQIDRILSQSVTILSGELGYRTDSTTGIDISQQNEICCYSQVLSLVIEPCCFFLLLYLFSELVALFDLGHSHLIDIGTEAY